jgi:hypothetical protein
MLHYLIDLMVDNCLLVLGRYDHELEKLAQQSLRVGEREVQYRKRWPNLASS